MTTLVAISQDPILQFLDDNGKPLVDGMLTTLVGGIPYPTWGDSAGNFPLPNPIILNNRGEVSTQVGTSTPLYVDPNVAYTFILQDANSVTVWTAPNIICAATAPVVIALINATVTASYIGQLLYPQTQAESDASVLPLNYVYLPGQPERYILPGFVTYATATDGSGTTTDFAVAIQTALNIQGQPCLLGAHLYRCESGLILPNSQSLIGQGIYETGLCFVASLVTGTVFGWNGTNASKIQAYGFSAYCNNGPTMTGGMVIGTNDNPVGTEGYMDQVMVRDLPANALAFDLHCNIAEFGNLYALNSAGVRFLGNGAIQQMENTNASGFSDVNANFTCAEMQDFYVGYSECEAPQSGLLLLTVRGQLVMLVFVPGLALSTTFTELIYITSSANNWWIGVPQLNYGGVNASNNQPTFTNLIYDQASNTYYGGGNTSTSTSLKTMCGFYSSSLMMQGAFFGIKKQPLNNFSLLVANNAGHGIQHKLTAPGQTGVPGTWLSSISGDSLIYNITPLVNATTDFAAGGGISAADNSYFVINTGAEIAPDVILSASITWNGTTTVGYGVRPTVLNLNVNGTTQNWLAFQLTAPSGGSTASWVTALGTATWFLEVTYLGFVR